MRESLHGLTMRGRSFVAAGTACFLAAFLVGQEEIVRLGVFLVALPLLAALVVSRTRYRLSCHRVLVPARIPAGQQATVRLRLENVSRLPTSVLFVEDSLAYSLGARPRFVLDRVEAGGGREVTYPVRSDVRGRFHVGPLSVRLTDPFGMCELTRSFVAVDELVVTPVISPLPGIGLGGEWAGGGDTQSRAVASAGEDDASTREYRYGDDLRKVHWKSTARTGELMVRREEQPWQSRATILLDTRVAAHFGDGPGSSFEWAVAAVASVGVHLARSGYALRFVTDAGTDLQTVGGTSSETMLLDQLAVVEPSRTGSIARAAGRLHRGGGEGLVVAVLGTLDADEALSVGRLRHSASSCVAVLVDTTSWTTLGVRAQAESAAAMDASASLLRAGGWRVLVASHGTTLASLWPQASRRGQRGVGALR
ncbi:MAG TPA: DUF58 domain-containing protein [Mycobacteriales bacterium]|nr:DUF58 domain-containing protein [Mycobacteriales bacterium]